MQEAVKGIKVKLNSIEDIKELCKKAEKINGYVDVISGRYYVDGKSLMGLFSLDYSKELEIRIIVDNESSSSVEGLKEFLKAYEV